MSAEPLSPEQQQSTKEVMRLHKQSSRAAGILILSGVFAGIFSVTPSIETDEYLTDVYPERTQVLWASFFQSLLIPIYIAFALIIYRILHRAHPSLMVGFVGFRFVAAMFQLLGVIILPLFILLSNDFLERPELSTTHELLGRALKLTRDLSNHVGVIFATGFGNFLLYYAVYLGKHLPTWLITFGVIGNALIVGAGYLVLFNLIDVVSVVYGVFALPLVVQEFVLAFWLIRKGL